jgi:BFD-like [2Fe-2S] binding domain
VSGRFRRLAETGRARVPFRLDAHGSAPLRRLDPRDRFDGSGDACSGLDATRRVHARRRADRAQGGRPAPSAHRSHSLGPGPCCCSWPGNTRRPAPMSRRSSTRPGRRTRSRRLPRLSARPELLCRGLALRAGLIRRGVPVHQGVRPVEIAGPETLLCRCESVTAGAYRETLRRSGAPEPNRAKSLSRVGMGRCQGRLCAAAGAEILAAAHGARAGDLPPLRAQPPVRPLPMALRLPARREEG